MPPLILDTEYLEIEGDSDGFLAFNTPAVHIVSLAPLLGSPAFRGENVAVGGVAGRIPLRHMVDETRVVLELEFFGEEDWEGNAYTEGHAGVTDNIDYYVAEVGGPPVPPAVTRTAVLHLRSGAVRSAEVQSRIDVGGAIDLGPAGVKATLDLVIPGGAWEAGS